MTCFLHPRNSPPAALSSPSPVHAPSPGLCHDSGREFPGVARDYMGVGLVDGAMQLQALAGAKKKNNNPVSETMAGLSSSSCDHHHHHHRRHHHLCGHHLHLAPPSSSPDEGEADDGEPLSGNVGWPPISSYRKATTRMLSMKQPCNARETTRTSFLLTQHIPIISDNSNQHQNYNANHHDDLKNDDAFPNPFSTKPSKSLHIKVSMDGTPIMRKLDLISIQGYKHLFFKLRKLFKFYKRNFSCNVGVCSNFKDPKGANYILTYKNEYGDWIPVEGTSWKNFTHLARRIRIMKVVE